MKILPPSFYKKDTLRVARELLGCFLVRDIDGEIMRARIVETEAYIGEDDLACHASKGRMKRTETLYGEAGHAYVYLVYGMYHCLNVVTERKDFPAAVLIRAVEIENVSFKQTNGPGKLCRFLNIDRTFNGADMTSRKELWIEKGNHVPDSDIAMSPRIGIDYAKHSKEYPWRFFLKKDKSR